MFPFIHFIRTPNGFDLGFLGIIRFGTIYIKNDRKTETTEMLCFDMELFSKLGFGVSLSLR